MSITLDETRDGDNKDQETGDIEASEYAERLELLYEVAEKVSSVSEVSELLEEILSITQRLLKASAASVFLIDQEREELYVQAAGGQSATALKQIRLDLDSGIVGWVANHGKPLTINDVTSDKRFNKDTDKVTGFVTRSILAVPMIRGRKVIGVLEVLNKADGSAFDDQDLRVLTGLVSTEALILLVSMAAVAITNIKLSQTAVDSCKNTVETLVTAADARDPYAWGHSQRVREYTLMGAVAFSFPEEELRIVEFGGLLHDIGKIGISESVLRKSGPLTAEEWYMVRKHPLRGANIVGQIPYLEKAKNIVLYHHERYDGAGYPQGLKGEDIPIGARLVAVADAFDTMTTDHSYRAALSVDEAMSELVKGMRTQFCPVAVTAFISGFKKQNPKLSITGTEKAPQDRPEVRAQGTPPEKPAPEVPEVVLDAPSLDVPETPPEPVALPETAGERPAEMSVVYQEKPEGAELLTAAGDAPDIGVPEAPPDSPDLDVQKMLLEKLSLEIQGAFQENPDPETPEAVRDARVLELPEVAERPAEMSVVYQEKPEAAEVPPPAPDEPGVRAAEAPRPEPGAGAPATPRDKAKKGIYPTGTETYEGEVHLIVPSPASYEQVRQFQECLQKVDNLRITLVGGAADEGALIVVSVRPAVALAQAIKEIPGVEAVDRVAKRGKKKLMVTLKAGTDQ